MTTDVRVEIRNNIGWIILNRPHALNALSYDMIRTVYQTLIEWETDDSILIVCMKGAGGKAFCAGGDVKRLYELKNSNVHDYVYDFFSTEYKMNLLLHKYEKPIIALLDGIVMGGGVGLSIGAKYRIVTEKTRWSMPEMNIGLFPDVGGSYFLSKMPKHVGRYLALTSDVLGYQDAIAIGAADYYLLSSHLVEFESLLNIIEWHKSTVHHVLHLTIKRLETCVNFDTDLRKKQLEIEHHFGHNSIEEIIESLKQSAYGGDEWARNMINILYMKSPISMKVTLEQLIRGRGKSIEECFEMEMNMSMNFMDNDDFFEGVRSVLIDKDYNPEWRLGSLSEIDHEHVVSFFNYDWPSGNNPLLVKLEE